MSNKQYKSPLHEMACTTATSFWNDSCSVPELTYALEYGAVGATTNPVIVKDVLQKEMNSYKGRIEELIRERPIASEDDIAWALNEEMAVAGAKFLNRSIQPPRAKRADFHSDQHQTLQEHRTYVAAGAALPYTGAQHPGKDACHPSRHQGL